MARNQPLNIYQGDDFNAVVNLSHDGTPVDLTGYTAAAQIKRTSSDTTVVATLSATVDATFSRVTLALSHTVTATLTGTYWWDLQLTSSTGSISTPLYGPVYTKAQTTV